MNVYMHSFVTSNAYRGQCPIPPLTTCRPSGMIYQYQSRCSFGSVPSRSGGAPLVPPAHAHVAAQGTRDGPALALARPVAWATGLGPPARLPSSERATNTNHQRLVPPGARLVPCRPVVAVRLSCLQRTLTSLLKAPEMGLRLRSLGLWLGQRA